MPGERGITIRVKDGLMFPSASDSLRDEAAPVFSEIAELTRMHPDYQLSVEGYTDDVPIHTQRFPSNWELSAARAVAGVRRLIEHEQVDPERVNAAGFVDGTLERGAVWLAQTPQAFRYSLIREAHERARQEGFAGTDDASLVERLGRDVKVISGSSRNIKITTPEDLILATAIFDSEAGQSVISSV